MKKLTALIIVFLLFVFGCAGLTSREWVKYEKPASKPSLEALEKLAQQAEAAANARIYHTLTGGGSGALDSTAIAGLTGGDPSFVFESDGDVYLYVFDSSATDAENSPYYIRPDDYSSSGVWVLTKSFAVLPQALSKIILRDSDATDFDDNFYLQLNCTDTGSGTEDCDISMYVQVAGTPTEMFKIDADGDLEIAQDVDIASGKLYKINNVQITSSALSDVNSIAMLDEAETIAADWDNTGNPWADNEVADGITLTNITQITNRSHTSLSDVGSNTHAQIDTHIAAANPHSASGDVTNVFDCASGDCDDFVDAPAAFGDGDTTPDVSSGVVFITANTSPTTINDFDTELTNGKIIKIIVDDALTTFDFTSSGLEGTDSDYLASNGEVLEFIYTTTDNQWHYLGFPKSISVDIAGFTANRALETDATGKVEASAITDTELNYLDGVTSSIQTQIDAKEGTLTNEAGLYSALSDVSQFYEPGDTMRGNSGTSLPGSCTVGDQFLDTDADTDGSLYTCVATDTWKEVDDDGAGAGEANTASSQGSGSSIYYQKSGVDLQFNAIKSETDDISVSVDGVSHDIEFTFNPANINLNEFGSGIPNLATNSIDAITEITSGLRSGSDGTLITGTAGTNTYGACWNADGDIVDCAGVPFTAHSDVDHNQTTNYAANQHFLESAIDHGNIGTPGTGADHSYINQDVTTTGNPQFATIELGHASDTTLARSGAGAVTIEGVAIQTGTDDDVPEAGDFGAATDLDSNGALNTGSVGPNEAVGLTEDDMANGSDLVTDTIAVHLDGGGSALTDQTMICFEVSYAATIIEARLLADQSGSVVVDWWVDTYANYPPTNADSITASATPTITTAVKDSDATLSGWTTSIAAEDTICAVVEGAATTITWVTAILKVEK